jgi:uncharacterized protein (DUF427 family)
LTSGPRKIHPTSRRVRVVFNHTYIVDTTSAVHVWEHDGFPQFYVPIDDLKAKWVDKEKVADGGAAIVSITVGESDSGIKIKSTDRAVRFLDDGKGDVKGLKGLVRLEFGAMDAWFEEDTPIYVHPKDPFKRIDILSSSRPITIKLNGHTLASSSHSLHLLETGLPTRYYLPYSAVDPKILRHSDLKTKCPYKGEAEYHHVVLPDGKFMENLVWYYRTPTAESAPVAGLLCFYNEKVDIELDGKQLERPKTHFA